MLLERVIDISEFAVQVGTQTVDRGNDCEGNTRGNQAVFDRGGTRLVLHEPRNKLLHDVTPRLTHQTVVFRRYLTETVRQPSERPVSAKLT